MGRAQRRLWDSGYSIIPSAAAAYRKMALVPAGCRHAPDRSYGNRCPATQGDTELLRHPGATDQFVDDRRLGAGGGSAGRPGRASTTRAVFAAKNQIILCEGRTSEA